MTNSKMTPFEIHVYFSKKNHEVNHIGIVIGMHLREPLPYKNIFIVRESCVEYAWSKWSYIRRILNNTRIRKRCTLRKRESWEKKSRHCLLVFWLGSGGGGVLYFDKEMETAPSFSIFIYFTFYLFIHLENAIGGVGKSLSFALFSLHHKYIAPKSFLLYGVTVIVTINVYHHQQLTTILIFFWNNSKSTNPWTLMGGPHNQDLFVSQLPSPLN